MVVFDKIGEKALDIINNSNDNLFLTGKAGTGKTTLLKYVIENSSKNSVVIAFTGVAALNVGGQTIHSFFGFMPDITRETAIEQAQRSKKKDLYKKLQMIIIDEVSMVRADLMDCIDMFLQTVLENQRPFGGIQMIFVGDLFQLPPVVTTSDEEIFSTLYESPYFFSSHVFNSPSWNMKFIELEKIYRQTDQNFINILNKIRNKTVDESDLEVLNQQISNPKNISYENGTVCLCSRNFDADKINEEKLDSIGSREHYFDAFIDGDFKKTIFPTSQELILKKGAQVMFVANDLAGKRKNGTLGEIEDIQGDDVFVKIFDTGETHKVDRYTWEITRYFLDKFERKIKTETIGSFTQFPLKLAWAITIHKSQGKTFNNMILNLQSGLFAHGQAYVALSRCTNLKGIKFLAPLKISDIIIDPKVIDFYNVISQTKE